jgi:hypothetical protein
MPDAPPPLPPLPLPPVAFPPHAVHPEFSRALLPGDLLLYSRSGFFNRLISIKTWSRFTHVEVAIPVLPDSPNLVAAARNGEGCGIYAYAPQGLALVLRPLPQYPFSIALAMHWFRQFRIQEQGYDWLGLLNFTYARLASRDNG